jgi:hypothetical protein
MSMLSIPARQTGVLCDKYAHNRLWLHPACPLLPCACGLLQLCVDDCQLSLPCYCLPLLYIPPPGLPQLQGPPHPHGRAGHCLQVSCCTSAIWQWIRQCQPPMLSWCMQLPWHFDMNGRFGSWLCLQLLTDRCCCRGIIMHVCLQIREVRHHARPLPCAWVHPGRCTHLLPPNPGERPAVLRLQLWLRVTSLIDTASSYNFCVMFRQHA